VTDAVRWQVLLVTADRLHNTLTPEVIFRTTNFHINSEFPRLSTDYRLKHQSTAFVVMETTLD
jgi:hypothetical protein